MLDTGYSAESCGYCKHASTGRRTASSRESISPRCPRASVMRCRRGCGHDMRWGDRGGGGEGACC
jgi:hypothetical protein